MKKYNFILFMTIFLVFFGIDYETYSILSIEGDYTSNLEIILAILVLGTYILPFILGINYLYMKWSNSRYLIFLSIFISYFSTGWLAELGNSFIEKKLLDLLTGNTFYLEWSDALVAPILEESIKIACVLTIIYILKLKEVKQIFLIGVCVGLGFQISEDVSYILNASIETNFSFLGQALLRVSTSFSSHWLYTGILTMGVLSLKNKKTDLKRGVQLVYIFSPIILHSLWNSPLNNNSTISSFISAVSICILLNVVYVLDNQFFKINNLQ